MTNIQCFHIATVLSYLDPGVIIKYMENTESDVKNGKHGVIY
jgi:hypothetical protein